MPRLPHRTRSFKVVNDDDSHRGSSDCELWHSSSQIEPRQGGWSLSARPKFPLPERSPGLGRFEDADKSSDPRKPKPKKTEETILDAVVVLTVVLMAVACALLMRSLRQ